jgi:uncharacterized membrane protein
MHRHNDRSHHKGSRQNEYYERLANGLGWFSIGLGVAELLAPGGLAKLIGINDDERTRGILRFYGLREIGAGVGILTNERPGGWLWSRVAGDMVDLSSLVLAFRSAETDQTRVGIATAAVLGVTAIDVICAQELSGSPGLARTSARGRVRYGKTITVNRSPQDVYDFWHNLENFPSFMRHLDSVQVTGRGRSHWKAKAPGGYTVEWDAEIVRDEPGSEISWRSVEGSRIENSGTVRFEAGPGGRGTFVRVEVEYAPPGGALAAKFAKLFGEEPELQMDDDLRSFKAIMETGEVVKSDASIHRGMHAAQPPRPEEKQELVGV